MRTLLIAALGLGFGVFDAARAADLAELAGNYRLGSGHVIAIAEWEPERGAPHMLVFTDLKSGRIGVLTEKGTDEWALPSELMSGGEAARIRFERGSDGVRALTVQEVLGPVRRAARIADRHEEFTFFADSVALRGTLWLPPGAGPFPTIVLVPAGPLSRHGSAMYANFFLAQGHAVLAYDRRAGPAPFPRYAEDAVAAVDTLRRRRGIDRKRIGLWGSSQGGWLALMAAARSPDVAFVISQAGMLVPAWRQELYRLESEAVADGIPTPVIEEALAFERRLFHVAESATGWDSIAAALAIRPRPPWHDLVYQPSSLEQLQRVWKNDFSFDPRKHITGVRRPVLALFGGLDRSTPIESAGILTRAIGSLGRVEIEFFPTANHAFLDADTGGPDEIPRLSRFVPGFFDRMRDWLRARAR